MTGNVHKAEEFMQAFFDMLRLGMPEIAVSRDDVYASDQDIREQVDVTQGDETYLNQNMSYTDTELTINVDITVVQRMAAIPVGTLINARRAKIVQLLAPTQNGSDSLGVKGASQLLEGDSFAPIPDHTDRVVSDMRMVWTVQLRRNVDDPTQFT